MENTYLELVMEKARNLMESKGVTIDSQSSVMKVLRIVMECVETVQVEKQSGTSKKDIVLKVILDLVNESECDEDKKVVLRELIEEGTLETTIEFVVDASKGKLELNKKTKKKLLGCLGQCLVTLSKK